MKNLKICIFVLIVGLLLIHCILIEETLELSRHRGGIYISQENVPNDRANNSKIVYLFKKMSEEIGAYGMFSYTRNYNLPNDMRDLFKNAIEKNVAFNGQVKGKWMPLLKKTMSKMKKILRVRLSKAHLKTEFAAAVIVVDKYTAMQARWIPIPTGPKHSKLANYFRGQFVMKSICRDFEIMNVSNYTKVLYMVSGLTLDPDQEKRALMTVEKIKDWKKAARVFINIGKEHGENVKNRDICAIAIEIDAKWR